MEKDELAGLPLWLRKIVEHRYVQFFFRALVPDADKWWVRY